MTLVRSTDGLRRALFLVLLAFGCGGKESASPSGPAPSGPTTVSVSVGGNVHIPAPGQTSQLVATATLSDLSTRDVTASATWQSSDAAVASVSAAGLVTGVATGTAKITGTYAGKSGSVGVLIPVTVASLAVTGTTSIPALGSASQLTATATLGAGVTQSASATVAWQSSNSAVATVSASGLVTAVSPGSATITATLQGKVATALIAVTSATAVAVSSCRVISTPGVYTLSADISGAVSNCIQIQGSNVDLECGGHTVADSGNAIAVLNATNAIVNNCVASSSAPAGAGIDVESAHYVTIANSTVTSPKYRGVRINRSQYVSLSNSLASGGATAVEVTSSTFTQIVNNRLTIAGSAPVSVVVLVDGSGNHNSFSLNQILGAPAQATDDGILLNSEDSALIQGNTFANFFDAGIESVGPLTKTTIADNTITNAGTAAIASYWSTYWLGNTVSGNQVSQCRRAIKLEYDGILPAGEPQTPLASTITFQDNTFTENHFDSTTQPAVSITFAGEGGSGNGPPLPQPLVASNNVFADNTLGAGGPFLLPASAFVDGGGNVCGPGGTVLSCASAASRAAVSLRIR